jgi:hypothetical protein
MPDGREYRRKKWKAAERPVFFFCPMVRKMPAWTTVVYPYMDISRFLYRKEGMDGTNL